MNQVPHTITRCSIYYFNFRIPSTNIIFRKSLKTDFYRLSVSLVDEIIKQINKLNSSGDEMSKGTLNSILDSILNRTVCRVANSHTAILRLTELWA